MSLPRYRRVMKFVILTLTGLLLATTVFTAQTAYAENDPIYTSWRNNLAIGGYDTVSVFNGTPIEGSPNFKTEYQGAVWLFSSRAHLDLFNANPAAFAPKYGGYCAWAVAKGKLAKGDPKFSFVKDGDLYLNFNVRTQEKWNEGRDALIQKANENWPAILDK